jgi:TRAP-type C4-dicarboxylate transport system permease small subunit
MTQRDARGDALDSFVVMRAMTAVVNGVASVSRYGTMAAGWLYLAAALYITSDVITRRFGFSTQATDEITNYILAVGTSWSMAYSFMRKDHVRVEVILLKLPKTVQGFVNTLALGMLTVLLAILIYGVWTTALDSIRFDARANTALHTPLAWPQVLWAVGWTSFLLMAVLLFIQSLLSLVTGHAKDLARTLGPRSIDESEDDVLTEDEIVAGSIT